MDIVDFTLALYATVGVLAALVIAIVATYLIVVRVRGEGPTALGRAILAAEMVEMDRMEAGTVNVRGGR